MLIVTRFRNCRFNTVYILMPHKAHRTTGKGRHVWKLHRLKLLHECFDKRQRVVRCRDRLRSAVLVGNMNLRFIDAKNLTRIGSQKRVATDIFSPNNGFKEKGRLGLTNFGIGPQGRLAVGRQVQIDRERIARLSERFKLSKGGLNIHEVQWRLKR